MCRGYEYRSTLLPVLAMYVPMYAFLPRECFFWFGADEMRMRQLFGVLEGPTFDPERLISDRRDCLAALTALDHGCSCPASAQVLRNI